MRSRWLVQARRWRRYTEGALSVSSAGPPWHRGIVAVATLVFAVVFGLYSGLPMATVVAPALAFFLTLADVEGTLATRLAMLTWSAGLIACSGTAALAWMDSPFKFDALFAALTFLAGLLAWAGAPFLQATRFAVIVGLLLTNTQGVSTPEFLELLLVAFLIAVAARTLESMLAPDRERGPFSTPRQGWFKLRAARPVLWRYALCYTIAAASAWGLGKQVDHVHPTWLTVSTLVVMWPDASRSYQRIVQRVFGTVLGAFIALVLISAVPDPVVLSMVALGMAFFLPHFIRRNYWLHSGLVVVFVLVALHVSSQTAMSNRIATERIADVLLGCVFAMFGTLAAFGSIHRRASRAAVGTGH